MLSDGGRGRRQTASITAYRNRSDDEIRDNFVARFVNGKWLAPQPVFNDNWKIAACPVNGPALAANGRNVAMTWFTVKQEQGQAYLAFSQDAGATFGAPIRVDDGGSLGRVDVELLAGWRRAGDVDRVCGSACRRRSPRAKADGRSSAPAASIATAHGRRRSPWPASPAAGPAATRARRSPTAKSCLRGPNPRTAAACRFAPPRLAFPDRSRR